jgi:translocator protein
MFQKIFSMKSINLPQLATAIVVCLSAGLIGSVFTSTSLATWYGIIEKPVLNPPSWIFGPVWTILYIMMGISVYLVWRLGLEKKGVRFALKIFGLQLLHNVLWSLLFFGMQNPALALVDIVLLWFTILWSIQLFYRLSRPASYLLIPYISWVSFAIYLNYSIWILN